MTGGPRARAGIGRSEHSFPSMFSNVNIWAGNRAFAAVGTVFSEGAAAFNILQIRRGDKPRHNLVFVVPTPLPCSACLLPQEFPSRSPFSFW